MLVIGVYLALPPLSTATVVQHWVKSCLHAASGYEIDFRRLRLHHDLSLTVDSFSAAAPNEPPFLTAHQLDASVRPWNLFQRRLANVTLTQPQLFVKYLPKPQGTAPSPIRPLGLDVVRIRDGSVHYTIGSRDVTLGPMSLVVDTIQGAQDLMLRGHTQLAAGNAEIEWSAQLGSDLREMRGEIRGQFSHLTQLLRDLVDINIPAPLAAVSGSALLSFHGDARNTVEAEINGTAQFPGHFETITITGSGEMSVFSRTGSLQLIIEAAPALPPVDISGTFFTTDQASGLDVQLRWQKVPLSELTAHLPSTRLEADGTLTLTAQVSGSTADLHTQGRLRLADAAFRTESWHAAGDVTVAFHLTGTEARFETPGIQLHNASGEWQGFAWKLADATATGILERPDDDAVRAAMTLSLSGLAFHDPELLRVADGLNPKGTVELRLGPEAAPVVDFDISIAAGEFLWHQAYANLAEHHLTLRGSVRSEAETARVQSTTAAIDGVGTLTLDGTYDWNTSGHILQMNFAIPGLSTLYELGLREPFKQQYPMLDRTSVGGTLTGDLKLRRDAAASVRVVGRINLRAGSIAVSTPSVHIRGLDFNLPVDLKAKGEMENPSASTVGPLQTGGVRIADLKFGGVDFGTLHIPLATRPDEIFIGEPVRLTVLEGGVELTDFTAQHLLSEDRSVTFGLTLDDLDLAALTRAMNWPPLIGRLAGSISRVTVAHDQIHSEGEIRIEVFGGGIRIRNLRVEQVLSPVPRLELDVDFSNISLAQLTETAEVGHISGIARGAIHDLAIVSGEPLRFDAWMETIPTKGIRQRISVDAIRQLSILGGSGGDPFSQGVLSFFDEYRYAKMGFRCELRNDRFILEGVESQDDREYLVVGSFLPPRVNVISHNQTISFSEMVRRIGRVFATPLEGEHDS